MTILCRADLDAELVTHFGPPWTCLAKQLDRWLFQAGLA
eukprot:CAMPEP_0119334254 /NCGR_PEP_ID=MMETSP1333-20130426/86905_1 /TAXON_ID=418940 /ORGANISM="Scyphosphaera apsteinii, Strain RCC1455" /LENGTH=38 /DNA_ID= /DNA_START= /DNA_END= /DNA_ORIENTATION=